MSSERKLGVTATLMILLVIGGLMTILGIVVWLRMAPASVHTQPAQPRSSISLPLPPSQQPKWERARFVVS